MHKATAGVRFTDYGAAVDATRAVAQSGLFPTNCRLLDAGETLTPPVAVPGHRQRGRRRGAAAAPALPAQAAGDAAAGATHPLRPGDARPDGVLHGHRELLEAPVGSRRRRAPADPARLLPRRLPDVHRREPHRRAPAAGHVPRRPVAQANSGRIWLSAAVGARQPAPDLRGVRGAGPAGGLRLRHPRTV